MSAGKISILLDSSAVIGHFKRVDLVREKLAAVELLYLPLTAYAELRFGGLHSNNPNKKLDELGELMQIVTILYPSRATADIYAEIRLQLRKNGTPIPESDIWIAAMSIQYGVPLLTSDKKHFSFVEGLDLELF